MVKLTCPPGQHHVVIALAGIWLQLLSRWRASSVSKEWLLTRALFLPYIAPNKRDLTVVEIVHFRRGYRKKNEPPQNFPVFQFYSMFPRFLQSFPNFSQSFPDFSLTKFFMVRKCESAPAFILRGLIAKNIWYAISAA